MTEPRKDPLREQPADAPPSGGLDPAVRDQLLNTVAERVCRMGLAVPAIFFLESCKPLNFVGSQAMVFFGPFVQSLFSFQRYYEFAALMEERENVERLLQEIERREDEEQRRHREARARRREEKRQAAEAAGPRRRAGLLRKLFPLWLAAAIGTGTVATARAQTATGGSAAATNAVAGLEAADTANDRGGSVDLTWDRSPADRPGSTPPIIYRIYRAASPEGPWRLVGRTRAGRALDRVTYTDATAPNGTPLFYRVGVWNGASESFAVTSRSVIASGQWFNRGRVKMLVAVLVLSAAILLYIRRAQSGARVYLRPVAGLKAFADGVGRATEMGRKVLFIPGVQDLDQVETVAGVIILGYVAKMTATYETPLEVPVNRALVMATAREVTRQAYQAAGRPDLYHDDMVHYITYEQFAYAAAVNGIMLRDRPGTVFYQGRFLAESLILAETGNSVGAIQIAGTASPAQLPFFVVACDFTLIGEELFAASAYLSQEPKLVGSIRGQDVGKILFMIAIVVGVILETLAALGLGRFSIAPWFDV